MDCKISELFRKPIPDQKLKRAISYLNHAEKEKKRCRRKNHCLSKHKYCWNYDPQVNNKSTAIKCRHVRYLEDELRKSLLLHDWKSGANLLSLLIETGVRQHDVFIIKVCSLLMFHHPAMFPELLRQFLNSATNYLDDSEIEEFILLILTIRKTILFPSDGNFKFKNLKVIGDPSYGLNPVCKTKIKKEIPPYFGT